MPPGTNEARHRHERTHQFFFVLSGTATLEVSGRHEVLGPGQGLEVAPGVPHQMFNDSGQAVEFLVISSADTRQDRAPA